MGLDYSRICTRPVGWSSGLRLSTEKESRMEGEGVGWVKGNGMLWLGVSGFL